MEKLSATCCGDGFWHGSNGHLESGFQPSNTISGTFARNTAPRCNPNKSRIPFRTYNKRVHSRHGDMVSVSCLACSLRSARECHRRLDDHSGAALSQRCHRRCFSRNLLRGIRCGVSQTQVEQVILLLSRLVEAAGRASTNDIQRFSESLVCESAKS